MSHSDAYFQLWRSRNAQQGGLNLNVGQMHQQDVVMGRVMMSETRELLTGIVISREEYNQILQQQRAGRAESRANALQSMARR
ncbi:MAG: hypothetical protein Q8L78_04210 [Coxiellaceae bacterium]|nr:hypothetical protein [Coxiellaceae bacterium]